MHMRMLCLPGDGIGTEIVTAAGTLIEAADAASLNVGERHAIAQAQHGPAPDIAGPDRANPVSLIGSAAMLLRDLGRADAAAAIEAAIDRSLRPPETRATDLGGALGTRAFAAHLAATTTKAAR